MCPLLPCSDDVGTPAIVPYLLIPPPGEEEDNVPPSSLLLPLDRDEDFNVDDRLPVSVPKSIERLICETATALPSSEISAFLLVVYK